MKKAAAIICSLIMSVFILTAFMTKDPPKFKNLKILKKDISEHDLDSIMHHFAMSLGQRCNFCHVRNNQTNTWDMASDENPYKNVARKMMLMASKINSQNFPPEDKNSKEVVLAVTCYTCHHGQAIPETKAPMPPQFRDSTRRPPVIKSDSMRTRQIIRDSTVQHLPTDSIHH